MPDAATLIARHIPTFAFFKHLVLKSSSLKNVLVTVTRHGGVAPWTCEHLLWDYPRQNTGKSCGLIVVYQLSRSSGLPRLETGSPGHQETCERGRRGSFKPRGHKPPSVKGISPQSEYWRIGNYPVITSKRALCFPSKNWGRVNGSKLMCRKKVTKRNVSEW